MAKLLEKIEKRTVQVGIVGLGYIGKPLAMAFTCQGIRTIGIDTDPEKTKGLPFAASTDYTWLKGADVIIIAVPTGLNESGKPDLRDIIDVAIELSAIIHAGQLVILESSVAPGTTEELLQPWLEGNGRLNIGEDIFLGYSPERADSSRPDYDVTNMTKVVSGMTIKCATLVRDVYEIITKTYPVKNMRTAEMAKMLENTYRLVNISLVNELKLMAQKLDIDMCEVVDATATRPFGYTAFYPSAGAGGHCVPVDPVYLAQRAKNINVPLDSVKWALEVNEFMPFNVIKVLIAALKAQGKTPEGSKVLVLGITYKPETSDIRGSIGHKLLGMLKVGGVDGTWSDPLVSLKDQCKLENEGYPSSQVKLISTLQNHDATIIVTNHKYNIQRLMKYCPILIDTCNATKGRAGDNVYHA